MPYLPVGPTPSPTLGVPFDLPLPYPPTLGTARGVVTIDGVTDEINAFWQEIQSWPVVVGQPVFDPFVVENLIGPFLSSLLPTRLLRLARNPVALIAALVQQFDVDPAFLLREILKVFPRSFGRPEDKEATLRALHPLLVVLCAVLGALKLPQTEPKSGRITRVVRSRNR